MNENSLKNLRPFVKGDPRRVNKPKGAISLTTILKQIAKKRIVTTDDIDGLKRRMTVAEKLQLKLVAMAIDGDLGALKEINDRLDGKVAQQLDHNGSIVTIVNEVVDNAK